MADYYPVLTRAISGLDPNTAETRRGVYERARQAIVKQLRGYDPPLSESEITKERLNLEEAVRRIEAEHRAQQNATAAQNAAGAPNPEPPPLTAAPSPMAPNPARPPSAPPASPPPPSSARPPAPPQRMTGGEGLQQVHAAAAAAASLGAATANAQVSANTTRAAFDGPNPNGLPPTSRVEPNFRSGLAGDRLPPGMDAGDLNPNLREPEEEEAPPRRGGVGSLIAVVLLLAIGVGGFLMRDQIMPLLGLDSGDTVEVSSDGPKSVDRVGGSETVPGTIAREETPPAIAVAPTEAPPAETPPVTTMPPAVAGSQRAILYDEAPDKQGGQASSGAVMWRTEPKPDAPSELQLIGDISIPDRQLKATFTLTRNLDNTLPASHVIEVGFTLPPDFNNVGVGNVPGILFKKSEEEGGSPLKGMSVKVTKNLFWIGLEATPADRAQNIDAIRSRGWVDIPILYDNGRRAVLTIEKGPVGEQAFEAAFAAWDTTPAVALPPAR
ncbi:hypothetical protein IZ6_06400 [Terrihabitans soli]|uniref:Uncharacterized protein n=1 Tax=Terrihabitans soli TaxID=708113 RepID=A0A6S6QQ79_9HYPH|nr:hypothetical protein [Terrihabitans soli]BCJ89905.1 hypothetical protein IZ6_06400 [Terrihabitans soli]